MGVNNDRDVKAKSTIRTPKHRPAFCHCPYCLPYSLPLDYIFWLVNGRFYCSSYTSGCYQTLLVIVPQAIVDDLQTEDTHEKVLSSTGNHEPRHGLDITKGKVKSSLI
jgi:hypothetical protein